MDIIEELTDDEDEIIYTIEENTLNDDILEFQKNYESQQKTNISRPYLTKFEKTKVISERAQQISNGSKTLLKNPKAYNSPYEMALEELRQKKIPFIIKRPVANKFEYWKLEDLHIL
jgi:DNA-directed RNA polymerase I, II, and III subunit RPABC2